MSQYINVYPGGDKPSSPEEGNQHFSNHMDCSSSLGDSAISPANPLKGTNTVNPDGTFTSGSKTKMPGYPFIAAESMEAALVMASACPFLDTGGSLEVSELVEMPGN